jgi:Histidine kinase-, DNA gyrase B-, and HSP90-like ATPase
MYHPTLIVEGPYRDLGAGFARLTGVEGARRGPSRISHVEDALLELLRNSRDAGATRIYVASTLKNKRYRSLTVIDDGHGIPESHRDLILEPAVTTRHLDPVAHPEDPPASPHGAGLSLYQIRTRSLVTKVLSASNPTSIQTTFDTNILPERALQSTTRPSKTNLRATLLNFTDSTNRHGKTLEAYYGSPARILATLLHNRIIQPMEEIEGLRKLALTLGLEVSSRSVRRVLRGEVRPEEPVSAKDEVAGSLVPSRAVADDRGTGGGPELRLGEEERAGIADILRQAAHAGYLEVEDLRFRSRPGEISIRARVYEPEEEYE